MELLKLCNGIVDFAVLGDAPFNPTFLPVLGEMPLRRLSAPLYKLFGGDSSIDATHCIFSSLTHLDAFDNVVRICDHLPALPALTHLGLDQEVLWNVLQTLLAICARLEVLIVSFPFHDEQIAWEWVRAAPINDVRFVMGLYNDYADEWEAGAKGHAHFWSPADNFVARKRRGEIDAQCYWLHI
ncbi:hypothetical protein B0H17DRAFT_1206306 [Mycena rosella]|uniref:Uncharacterized protein n=1 Tax=Mycena rosella TaxID=1033263 RepID=A0AAD7D5E1_MYCRO|nr:hypothetical protein B0H17DRAFT_1206306 [Mycena rosella]